MKTLFITMALLLTTTIYASDGIQQKQKSVDQLLQDYNSSDSVEMKLKNENIQLQLELRETRRKYYAAKTALEQVNSTTAIQAEATYTEAQVREIINQRQSDTWYTGLSYATAERQFMLTLPIDDVKWYLGIMLEKDLERIKIYVGSDAYEPYLAEIRAEYKSYYDKLKSQPTETAQ